MDFVFLIKNIHWIFELNAIFPLKTNETWNSGEFDENPIG